MTVYAQGNRNIGMAYIHGDRPTKEMKYKKGTVFFVETPPDPPTPSEYDWDFTNYNYTIEQLYSSGFSVVTHYQEDTPTIFQDGLYGSNREMGNYSGYDFYVTKRIADACKNNIEFDVDAYFYTSLNIAISADEDFVNTISVGLTNSNFGGKTTFSVTNTVFYDEHGGLGRHIELDLNNGDIVIKDGNGNVLYSTTGKVAEFERIRACFLNKPLYIRISFANENIAYNQEGTHLRGLSYKVYGDAIDTPTTITRVNACGYIHNTQPIITLVDDNGEPYKTMRVFPAFKGQYEWWFNRGDVLDIHGFYYMYSGSDFRISLSGGESEDWTEGISSLLPSGFHIPTYEEMYSYANFVESFLGNNIVSQGRVYPYIKNNKRRASYEGYIGIGYYLKSGSDLIPVGRNDYSYTNYYQERDGKGTSYMWLAEEDGQKSGLKVGPDGIEKINIADGDNTFLALYGMRDEPMPIDDENRTKIAY